MPSKKRTSEEQNAHDALEARDAHDDDVRALIRYRLPAFIDYEVARLRLWPLHYACYASLPEAKLKQWEMTRCTRDGCMSEIVEDILRLFPHFRDAKQALEKGELEGEVFNGIIHVNPSQFRAWIEKRAEAVADVSPLLLPRPGLTDLQRTIIEELRGHAKTGEEIVEMLQDRGWSDYTIDAAYKELRRIGELENRQGVGYYVTGYPPTGAPN